MTQDSSTITLGTDNEQGQSEEIVPAELEDEETKRPVTIQSTPGKAGLVWVRSVTTGIEFTKTEVTVDQYFACADEGKCLRPGPDLSWGRHCNYGYSDRKNHPMNCVNWYNAKAFCEWAGGRLPTKEEWVAEASNKGKWKNPWGNAKPTCEYAVMNETTSGCGKGTTWPVCSKPAGNSISGICDMSGNVYEWTSSPHFTKPSRRVLLGGNWEADADHLCATLSGWGDIAVGKKEHPGWKIEGIRCVRSD